jgi:hypothetical protein
MTEPALGQQPPRPADALLAFSIGLWLALMQYSYWFLLEVHLSSRSTSFFVALFFWLLGFLVGLNLRAPRAFVTLVGAAPLAYYAALALLEAFPYRLALVPVVGAAISTAGMLAGAYFPHAGARFEKVKLLFFHENNGFIVGILASLIGSVFWGRLLLVLAPALGLLPVLGLLALERRRLAAVA